MNDKPKIIADPDPATQNLTIKLTDYTPSNSSSYSPSNTSSMSDDIRAIGQAFWEAKKDFKPTGKSGTNKNQGWDYASITDIYNGVEEALLKQKIIIWHFDRNVNGVEYLVTRLIHWPTGQWVEDMRAFIVEKPGNQGKGAANTYNRKQAIQSLCAIPCEDDDCEAEQVHIKSKAQNLSKEPISEKQVQLIKDAVNAASNGKIMYDNILSFNKIKLVSELPARSFESVMGYIENTKK
jgi:ERF superfamily